MREQTMMTLPTLQEAQSQLLQLPEDIKFIRKKAGLKRIQLARLLGVTPAAVWYWEKGRRLPEEPLILLILTSWAKKLKGPA